MMFSDYKDYLLWFLGILSSVLVLWIQRQQEKIKDIKNQLSEKKYKVYNDIFSIMFDLLKNTKNIVNLSEDELANRMFDIKKELMIYAPDSVLNKFLEWQNFVGDNPEDTKHLKIFLDLLVLIRKDMGHSSTKIKNTDLLRSIMQNSAEYERFKKLVY